MPRRVSRNASVYVQGALTRLVAASGVAAVLVLGACGADGTGGDRAQIQTAFDDVRDAVTARDEDAVCAGLGAKGRAHLAAMGHSKLDCAGGVVLMLDALAKRPGASASRGEPRVRDVRIVQTAVARIDIDGRTVKVPFVKEDGRWKLDSFYGLTPTPSVAIP